METHSIAKLYITELADRAIRLNQHLNAVRSEFYTENLNDRQGPQEKAPMFLDSLEQVTQTVLNACGGLMQGIETNDANADLECVISVVKTGFILLQKLHEKGLSNLPRPAVPIELSRFSRVIAEHVFKDPSIKISLYISEEISETTYASDPLGHIREKELKEFVRNANAVNEFSAMPQPDDGSAAPKEVLVPQPDEEKATSIDITIPRIGMLCPVNWATLFHESAHKLLCSDFLGGRTFSELISEEIGEQLYSELEALDIDLESWATEIWCDVFGAFVIGPAFFFAQYYSFVAVPPTAPPIQSKTHPPSSLRLQLIRAFLEHRNKVQTQNEIGSIMTSRIQLIEKLDEDMLGDEATMRRVKIFYTVMRQLVRNNLFTGKSNNAKKFRERFAEMIKYATELDLDRLETIYSELSVGLPTPSIRTSADYTEEKPTSLQEVLFAASLVRERDLQVFLAEVLKKPEKDLVETDRTKQILNKYDKIDEAVFRSIQLAEWLFMFNQEPKNPCVSSHPLPQVVRNNTRSFLNDCEISSLLSSGELRVSPLVDLDQQLGSSSLDLRLGTSFETFLPNSRHSFDTNLLEQEQFDSRRLDLDFLEHIVLLPGEFMLAHTFEYLRLPTWLGGELDGRSTYARLGLEVHMTAGMIDPGFEGTATFELFNAGPNSINLFPGIRIAQMRFRVINEPEYPYSTKKGAKYRGRLQHDTSLYRDDKDFQAIYSEITKRKST